MNKFLILLIFVVQTSLIASESFTSKIKCPVCQKSFISNVDDIVRDVDSYYSKSIYESDFSDLFILYKGIIACPYCMYSALAGDFNELNEFDKKNLVLRLPRIKLHLYIEEKKAISKINDLSEQAFFNKMLLTRACNKLRKKNKKRDFELFLQMYFFSKKGLFKEVNSFYRKKCLTLLRDLIDEKQYNDQEEFILTYLLGEFYRLEGENKKALDYFKKATILSEDFFSRKNWSGLKNWLKEWAYKQSCRINFSKLSVIELSNILSNQTIKNSLDVSDILLEKRIAIELLASKNDSPAWEVLRNYVIPDIKRLFELNYLAKLTKEKLQIDTQLWSWTLEQYKEAINQLDAKKKDTLWEDIAFDLDEIFNDKRLFFHNLLKEQIYNEDHKVALILVDYQVQSGETLFDIAKGNWMTLERLLEINPHVQPNEKLTSSTRIKIIKLPRYCFEETIIRFVADQINSGNVGAIKYSFAWFNTLNEYSIVANSRLVIMLLASLNNKKKLWEMPKVENFNSNYATNYIYDCLNFIKGQNNSDQVLLKYIKKDSKGKSDIAIACFGLLNDKSARNNVFELLKSDGPYFNEQIYNYLVKYSTYLDIPELLKLILSINTENSFENEKEKKQYFQEKIENIILGIKCWAQN